MQMHSASVSDTASCILALSLNLQLSISSLLASTLYVHCSLPGCHLSRSYACDLHTPVAMTYAQFLPPLGQPCAVQSGSTLYLTPHDV